MGLNPGALKDRVLVQRSEPVVLGSGFEQEAWVDVKRAWADIRPMTGSELFASQTLLGSQPARITMRYDPELDLKDTKLRLVDVVTGEVWQVESAQDVDNRRRELELTASQIKGGGQP